MQFVITCGGGGTRLWPLSTSNNPKQFVPIIDDESLLIKTYNRIRSRYSADNVWISTNKNYFDVVRNILPSEFASNHILCEPEKRDTFAAIASSCAVVAAHTSEDEPQVLVPCDHLIDDPESIDRYIQACEKSSNSLQKGEFEIISMSVMPSFASTQYGYIEVDKQNINIFESHPVPVITFREKPNQQLASEFFSAGNYVWNSNYVLTYSALKKNIKKLYPKLLFALEEIYTAKHIDEDLFKIFPKIPFDVAISEQCSNLGVIAMNIKWEDVGNWEIVYNHLSSLDTHTYQKEFGGKNNKIKIDNCNKKIAFVGVSDLLVVEVKGTLLIIDPKNSNEIKRACEYFELL